MEGTEEEYLEELGKIIHARRNAMGFTLEALAKKINVSKGHLSKIEHGLNPTSITILRRIAGQLNTTIGKLCDF
jgi:transcriptional regulator with XRE-family HTH domain